MLKKAGIVVATAAAGLLAVSPLAFAGDKEWGGHHEQGGHHADVQKAYVDDSHESEAGLINVSGNEVNVPVNVCGTDVNVIGISDLTAALGILAPAVAENGVECTNSATSGGTNSATNG